MNILSQWDCSLHQWLSWVCGFCWLFFYWIEDKGWEGVVQITGHHSVLFFFLIFYLLFIYYFYFWLCWVFVSVWGLSPVAASGGQSSSRCTGLSPPRPLLLRSTGSRRSGSAVVAHGPSRSVACGILPDQGSNPCPLHRQADSQPLRHQGSPIIPFFTVYFAGGRVNLLLLEAATLSSSGPCRHTL